MSKKVISLLLLVAISTSLVGCGGNKKVEDEPKATTPIEESKTTESETKETVETEETETAEKDGDDSSSYVGMGGGYQWVSEYKDVNHKTSTKGKESTSEKALKLKDIGIAGEYGTDYETIQCFDVQVTKVISGDSARKLIEKDRTDFPKPRTVGSLDSDAYDYVIVEYNKIIPSDYKVDQKILVNRFTEAVVRYVDNNGEKLLETFDLGDNTLEKLNTGEQASNQVAFILPNDCKEFSLRLGAQGFQTAYYNLTK